MINARKTLCFALAVALVSGGGALPLSAADDDPAAGRSADGEKDERAPRKRNGERGGEGWRAWSGSSFEALSDAEKAELRSALDAVWHDPNVFAAREAMQESMQKAGDAYKDALRKAMESANPKVREILTKMVEGHGHWGGGGPPSGGERPDPSGEGTAGEPKDPPFFRSLSEEDRDILRHARSKADEDDGVKAAVARKDAAGTTDEKIAALRDLREVLHKAMIAADPRVADVLAKLPVPGRDRGEGRRNGREGRDENDGRREGNRDDNRDDNREGKRDDDRDENRDGKREGKREGKERSGGEAKDA